jgi:ribosomal protein S18 acetylase RimI-like enzyme
MACRIWPAAYAGIIPETQIAYMLDRMYAEETLRREIAEDLVTYYWIRSGSERAGFLAVGPFSVGGPCALHKCYLLPERQRSGLGSAALAALVSRLSNAGATSLELRVNRHNTSAIAFYRKNCFEVYTEDCRTIGGGFVMDDYLMRRPLGS